MCNFFCPVLPGKTSLLKDNSWIRKPDDEEEPVE